MELYQQDIKGQPGGILISDIMDGEQILLLGKSNVRKRKDIFESFGGKVEQTDISSLHTAIRELVEEFFNIKISTEVVNEICSEFRKNTGKSPYILKQYVYYGVSYLINLEGLNKIYQLLILYDIDAMMNLIKYNNDGMFDVMKYIEERTIDGIPNDGLNEIKSIHIVKLNDIVDNKIHLRWFTNKIISKMLMKKKN